jgi:hypothetical protein
MEIDQLWFARSANARIWRTSGHRSAQGPAQAFTMNIEKLAQILREMEAVRLARPEETMLVRDWAQRIQQAITDHLLEQVGGTKVESPSHSEQPGGHGWDAEIDT